MQHHTCKGNSAAVYIGAVCKVDVSVHILLGWTALHPFHTVLEICTELHSGCGWDFPALVGNLASRRVGEDGA
jgi:hypothetical protein